jgi:hypothetical protein
MSEIDHFIEEVTEEVRRDRLFALYRKYGWIAAVLILMLVGGAAVYEYRKSQALATAERLGDDIIAALAENDIAERNAALQEINAETPGGGAVLAMMQAAAAAEAGQLAQAVERLEAVARDGNVSDIYRQIAAFKALLLQHDTLLADDLRAGFADLARPGQPLRLLAEEQLALIDISAGDNDAAIARLESIRQDAEAGTDLQQRASQLIVALGGTPAPLPDLRQG